MQKDQFKQRYGEMSGAESSRLKRPDDESRRVKETVADEAARRADAEGCALKRVHRTLFLLTAIIGACGPCRGDVPDIQDSNPAAQRNRVEAATPTRSRALLQDRSGNLWFLADKAGGVYRYDGSGLTLFTEEHGLTSNKVWGILESRDGHLWFATGDGVTRYDGATFTRFPFSSISKSGVQTKTIVDSFGMPEPMENSVLVLVQDARGVLWLGSVSGIYSFDGSGFLPFRFNGALSLGEGTMNNEFLMQDASGNLWIGGRGMQGVYRFDGTAVKKYSPDGAAWIYPILQDKSGAIWFGSVSNRVFRTDGKTELFSEETVFAGAWLLIEDSKGNFWYTSFNKPGVTRYDGSSHRTFTMLDGLGDNEVRGITEDRTGTIWFLTKVGLSRFDGQRITNLPVP